MYLVKNFIYNLCIIYFTVVLTGCSKPEYEYFEEDITPRTQSQIALEAWIKNQITDEASDISKSFTHFIYMILPDAQGKPEADTQSKTDIIKMIKKNIGKPIRYKNFVNYLSDIKKSINNSSCFQDKNISEILERVMTAFTMEYGPYLKEEKKYLIIQNRDKFVMDLNKYVFNALYESYETRMPIVIAPEPCK